MTRVKFIILTGTAWNLKPKLSLPERRVVPVVGRVLSRRDDIDEVSYLNMKWFLITPILLLLLFKFMVNRVFFNILFRIHHASQTTLVYELQVSIFRN